MAYVIKHNDPSPGYVSWSNMNMAYNGNTYAIADGNSDKIFIYWLLSDPYVMQTSDTFPTIAHTDVIVILNKNGTASLVPGSTILDGSLIVPGTILADALSANSVTSAKIIAGAIESTHISTGAVVADSIAAGAIGTAAIAAGAVISDHILADNVLATHIIAGAIQTAHIATGAVTANEIAASAVTTAKLDALAVTAEKIAADAVIAAKIKAGEITTSHIHVDGLDASVIKTGYLAAARIEAESITVDKLDARARNKVNNFTITSSLDGWSPVGTYSTFDIYQSSDKSAPVARFVSDANGEVRSGYFEVDPTQTYKVTMSVYCNDSAGSRYFGLTCLDKDGNTVEVIPFTISTRVWGSATTNPHFWNASGSLGTSYRDMEAYILGCNVTDANEVPLGRNVTRHYRLPSNAHRVRIRFLNYYNDGTQTTSYWYSPSVVAVDAGKVHATSVIAGVAGGARLELGESAGSPYLNMYDASRLRVELLEDRIKFYNTAGTDVGGLYGLFIDPINYLYLSSTNVLFLHGTSGIKVAAGSGSILLESNVSVAGSKQFYASGIVHTNSTIQAGGNTFPGVNNAYDLGTTSLRWKNLFLSGDVSIGSGSNMLFMDWNDIEFKRSGSPSYIRQSGGGELRFRGTSDKALMTLDQDAKLAIYGQLTAGVAGGARLELGESDGDPFLDMYDDDNTLRVELQKDKIQFYDEYEDSGGTIQSAYCSDASASRLEVLGEPYFVSGVWDRHIDDYRFAGVTANAIEDETPCVSLTCYNLSDPLHGEAATAHVLVKNDITIITEFDNPVIVDTSTDSGRYFIFDGTGSGSQGSEPTLRPSTTGGWGYIGTSGYPFYRMWSYGFSNASSGEFKEDIADINSLDSYEKLRSLEVHQYRYKGKGDSLHMGVIAEKAPADIVSEDGKAVDLYSYTSLIASAVQEVQKRLDALTQK